jgi:hypothetical protein
MLLGQRYHPIETLPPKSPDESVAAGIRLRAPHGCCDDLKVEVDEGLIESGGEDCVVVMSLELRRNRWSASLALPNASKTGSPGGANR